MIIFMNFLMQVFLMTFILVTLLQVPSNKLLMCMSVIIIISMLKETFLFAGKMKILEFLNADKLFCLDGLTIQETHKKVWNKEFRKNDVM